MRVAATPSTHAKLSAIHHTPPASSFLARWEMVGVRVFRATDPKPPHRPFRSHHPPLALQPVCKECTLAE